ncbi:polysaccharide deacetylase family protein [Muribaculaceae bacterium Isolate-039 (Harlan)]|jgi:peptidoglycan/xylan/chitin deacetylase (PgdA/CDA1 family)|uniref:polysaccharide deacetylase family protein n=1 Tax=Duncaniella muris TaxID=2094150 RepID=UPI000F4A77A1|nr:polysaccharide deacetylase family protein [Duncaniella muris]ROS90779.1 polysaccharide deacetylase family protein [Muribaculaceae bacterium Isolate-039 (Harlan)]ROS95680.1 polysaccharide deacetylase family protein [Muribaculaceae bacterium Isolate-083 (Janvier)]ROS98724.1 polysaccharide deacetylase family protein [Muribaculaceae bacterium Isolate-077 (Janvier)]ROT01650.1 polysaccharide deacetylase family protein [Muribaculaceae bacterium Isolate-084 (Janvier)]
MWIEQPPFFYRLLFTEAIWRILQRGKKVVYLTFDDGPIPEETPWVLDVLDRYGVKATFFMVGDNVRRYPELFEEVKRRGHSYGNHTMHHLQGLKVDAKTFFRDITKADRLIGSILFRPPHGIISPLQTSLIKRHYNIIMYDLVTRDYSKRVSGEEVLDNVKRYARNGSIIVFHDSKKAHVNMRYALPRAIEWLKEQGYEFLPLPM